MVFLTIIINFYFNEWLPEEVPSTISAFLDLWLPFFTAQGMIIFINAPWRLRKYSLSHSICWVRPSRRFGVQSKATTSLCNAKCDSIFPTPRGSLTAPKTAHQFCSVCFAAVYLVRGVRPCRVECRVLTGQTGAHPLPTPTSLSPPLRVE